MITNELWLNKFGRLRRRHKQPGGYMRKREIVGAIAFITAIAGAYLGILLGLVYTAVKVVKYAWQ